MSVLKKDHVMRDFFGHPGHFADFLNVLFFAGQKVVDASYLFPYQNDKTYADYHFSIEKRNDITMKWDTGFWQVLINMEAQSQSDYTMTSRILLYDALNYALQDKHQKGCRFMLVISLVLYHGEGKWKALTSLMDRIEAPEYLKRLGNDWKIKVVDLKELDYHLFRNQENRQLIKGLQLIWKKNVAGLQNMVVTKEVAKVLATSTGQEELVEIIEKEGEEKVEMYSLWKDAIHIGMEDGRKKGKEEGIKTGREAGIKEGMKEGIKTGRREGQQMLILHLLQNVLGQLTPEIKKRIQQCDEHMLQVIGMHIHQIHNEQDVLKLLM